MEMAERTEDRLFVVLALGDFYYHRLFRTQVAGGKVDHFSLSYGNYSWKAPAAPDLETP